MKRRYLLIIPLGLHLALVTFICLTGRLALWPDRLNENGILLSSDNLEYHPEVVSLAKSLASEGIRAFARTPSPFHLKLYSLSFYIFSPVFGNTMMSAEPVNVLLYLAILCLLFKLSRLICSREASLIAASVVAVWPSFLLHTTQLFRDPLFILAMLALVLITLGWLARVYTWRTALVYGFAGATSVALIWVVRTAMKDVVIAVGILGGALLLFKQIREKRFLAANTVGAVIVILACVSVPKFIMPYRVPLQALIDEIVHESLNTTDRSKTIEKNLGTPLATQIARLRDRFIDEYPDAGSNIDEGVRFNSTGDIARYLPRALAIGLFAPFPQMWFSEGKETGAAGRIVAGIETFIMYAFELLAAFAVWKMRRRWETWLLLLAVLIGVISLGLVITNVGALYRMRYVFWMLLIPVGAEGAVRARASWVERKRAVHMS